MSLETGMLHEALKLQSLQTNTSLLDYGLQMGLIEQTTNGQMTMGLLNIKLMSGSQVVRSVLLELLMRLGVFVSATGLVKLAMNSEVDHIDSEDGLRGVYVLSTVAHQIINFDETSIRTINRILMSIAIILFSLTSSNTALCTDMKKFKHKIRHRLTIDYYLWCLLFAMDLVLTCSSPLHINLEKEYGVELNISHVMLSSYCVINLSNSMQLIGSGRLTPLIIGTPLIFLDAGDDITLAKGLFLFIYYLCFWCSDWRELVDWNHPMLCEAGICKELSTEQGNLRHIMNVAKHKFDNWRLEEGLDDDGWFILLDPPPARTNGVAIPRTSGTFEHQPETEAENEREENNENHHEQEHGYGYRGGHGSGRFGQQTIDYTDRVIYLQSRNPLLTSLAAIMLIVWK